jgi:hypothetical protein
VSRLLRSGATRRVPMKDVSSFAAGVVSAGAYVSAQLSVVIGITQFPSTLHPNIDSMAAKSYVLGIGQRPFTAYDPKWQLICMLCTELPTIENGLAKFEKQAGGRDGIALTYTIRPDATWGDGTPVSTDDVSNAELYRPITGIDVVNDKTFVARLKAVYGLDRCCRSVTATGWPTRCAASSAIPGCTPGRLSRVLLPPLGNTCVLMGISLALAFPLALPRAAARLGRPPAPQRSIFT